MADKDQVKPLAVPSPSVYPETDGEEEAALRWRGRRLLWCCGCCCASSVAALGVLVLVLALTVFKVKDPVLTLNSIAISSFNLDFGSSTGSNLPVSVNVTLTADISLENPNAASFGFGSSTTEFYREGQTVGVAYAPAGKVGAHRTATMSVSVDVLADRVLAAQLSNASTAGLMGGSELDLTSFTDIRGRMNVLGISKRDIEVTMNCSIALEVSLTAQEIKSTECQADVR